MFLKAPKDSSELIPPYDGHFITVSQINYTSYKLSEIYTLKKKKMANDYGTWDVYEGLNVFSENFYLRRSNMNNTMFVDLKLADDCDVRYYC